MTREEVAHHVSYNGLGECVFELIQPSQIEDVALRKLWRDAAKKLTVIQEALWDEG